MAHIYEIAPEVQSNYTGGRKTGNQLKFPSTPVFQGFNSPSRLEADVLDLEVDGVVPADINGTFYRIQPDHRFPPLFEDDIHFNGDGSVTAIRIKDGHVDFKQRYVRTDRYLHETAARKSLFGRYRNTYTDNETVKGVIRTASNTNIVFWRGILLATKEDGPPFAMDPVTLETIGRYDFEGQVLSPTFTAHPKIDPETGEMICFGYEAGGDGNDASCDIVVYTIAADGQKTEESWYKAPFCGMIHDCGISRNYVVLPMTPLKCTLDRLKKGGNHWAWDPNEDQWYAIVPRRGGNPEDIIWLRADNGKPIPASYMNQISRLANPVSLNEQIAFHGHVAGCYENDEGHIVFDLTIADGNVFFFFPPESEAAGAIQQRNQLKSTTTRWIFNPKLPSGSRVKPAATFETNGEFSRIDDQYLTKPYNHFWQARVDPSRPYDFAACGPPAGGLFNCLGHYTWDTRKEDVMFAGPRATFQEATFIPKKAKQEANSVTGQERKEAEGYLIALVNRLDVLRNDIVILDALNVAQGPLAIIHLPLRLKLGLHGNWVDQSDIQAWQKRRAGDGGDVGPARAAERPLPWQLRLQRDATGEHPAGMNSVANWINGVH